MRLKQVLNWLGLVVVLAVNGLATTLPLNNQTTGEISDKIPVLFTPAGYVFSIWGLIYLALLAFVVYQSRSGASAEELHERIGYWFFASCVFNSAWIFAWHYDQVALSLLCMLGLLASLLAVYLRLDIGQRAVSASERRWVHLPFSIYLGWISVATVANVSALLYTLGWSGGPLAPEVWTVIMVVVAGVLGIAMTLLRDEVAYPLVIVWASVGIAVARGFGSSVGITAIASAVVVSVVLIAAWLRRRGKTAAA
jgi:hypothetical protein